MHSVHSNIEHTQFEVLSIFEILLPTNDHWKFQRPWTTVALRRATAATCLPLPPFATRKSMGKVKGYLPIMTRRGLELACPRLPLTRTMRTRLPPINKYWWTNDQHCWEILNQVTDPKYILCGMMGIHYSCNPCTQRTKQGDYFIGEQ